MILWSSYCWLDVPKERQSSRFSSTVEPLITDTLINEHLQ
jgi:hypothetical protein